MNIRIPLVWSWMLIALALGLQPAFAQGRWTGSVRGAFSAGVQADTAGLSQSIALIKNVESAPVTAGLSSAAVPLFDGGIAVRVIGNLGAGLSFSSVTRTDDAEISARIPHPFFFNQPRAISGVTRVEHREFATHISGVYVVGSPGFDVALSAGLSLFRVRKDFVEDIAYSEVYPYDTAAFAQAELTRQSASKAGFHGGADVTWKLGPRWGIGGLVRYSRASVLFGGTSVDAGGLQAGGGLRVTF